MFIRLVLAIVVVILVGDHEDSLSVRERESTLAKALNSKDKGGILVLTARDFHVYFTCGSVVRSFSTNVSRRDWINDVSRLPRTSYKATASKVRLLHAWRPGYELPGNSMAYVTVDEFWTIRLPQGGQVELHFLAEDTWVKLQGTWKLTGRIYPPRPCADDPYWVSPQ